MRFRVNIAMKPMTFISGREVIQSKFAVVVSATHRPQHAKPGDTWVFRRSQIRGVRCRAV